MIQKTLLSLGLSLALTSGLCQAEEWRQFRGPQANGLLSGKNYPTTWSEQAGLRWKATVPGEGWSAPIVVKDKVILTTAVTAGGKDRGSDHEWQVLCLDAKTGQKVWQVSAAKGKPRLGTHRDNTYASETPVSDGQHIVVYFGMTGLYCYDLEGQELWHKDLGEYPMQNEWGTASSPVIQQGVVFLQVDNEKESFLVALEVATGAEKWRVPRQEQSNWGTPILWKNSVRTELVTAGRTVRSYNPLDGKLLWQLTVNTGGVSSTPTASGDVLVVGNRGRQGAAMFAVKAGGNGDLSATPPGQDNPWVLWGTTELGPSRASPLVLDGKIYLLGQRGGQLTCLDVMTGKKVFEDRLPDASAFWASPWSVNGLIYCLDENGTTFVIKPGDQLNVVQTNKLPTETSARYWATLGASDRDLFIRSSDTLYAVSAESK